MNIMPRFFQKNDWVAIVLSLYTGLFILFLLLPIIAVVAVSFSSASFIVFPIPAFSMLWYRRVMEYQPYLASLWVSIQIAVGSATIGSILAVPAVLWIVKSQTKIASVLSALLLAPLSMPAIVLGFSLLYFLSALSIGISKTALLITHSVVAVPYIARTVSGVYRALGPSLEEAATILGASRWQVVRLVTIPLIRPGLFGGALFSVLISLDNLPLSFFFGGTATNTLPVVMLSYMQTQFDPSIAAISTIQMIIAVTALLVVDATYGIQKLVSS